MNRLSVKVKVLSVIIALTVISLSLFAYLTFQSYKSDKLAFVYDHLAQETQSKARHLGITVSNYDQTLGSIVSGLDFTTRVLPTSHLKYLKQQRNVSGLYVHIPLSQNLDKIVLFEADQDKFHNWSDLQTAPKGLSVIDGERGLFLIKKPLAIKGAWATLVFKQPDLAELFEPSPGKQSFLLNIGGLKDNLVPSEIREKVASIPMPFGLFEASLDGETQLVSFSKMNFQDVILVSMIQEKKVLLIQDMLFKQVILFLVLITSVALLIGTLGARWLTYHLDMLTSAAHEMENENFDVNVEINSKDELGVLGTAFNKMGTKIKGLLEELKRYNLELEGMVEERTEKLQNLTNIQNGMLNSLGQGFVIFDKENQIKPIYSKVAEEMFEVKPDLATPAEIMKLPEEEVSNFKDLFGMAFADAIEFDDVAKLNPEMRSNSKNQQIALNYAPIRNTESGGLDYVLIIGTDKTAEILNMEKFKKEWNFSQMIMKMASNRFALIKVINESMNMIQACLDVLETNKTYALRDVQRLVHTIKGNFSYFHVEEISHLAHDFESYLGPYYDEVKCPEQLKITVLEKVLALQVAIECYIDHYDSIIQYKDSSFHKSIAVKELDRFATFLEKKDPNILEEFRASFYKTKVLPFFQMYPNIVKDLGLKLNKEARFVLEGGDQELPDGPWDELFIQFIHVVRNSMAHGMETPTEREAAGKPAVGMITFAFEVNHDQLKITLNDDGKGIDWKKMATKDPSVTCEADAVERILTGGLSTQEEVSDISGRGVGVSSVYTVVKNWGGDMVIENNLGKGMSVVIHVSLHREKKQKLKLTA